MRFHIYLKQLRIKRFKDTRKMCVMLGVTKSMWRKIERGINPPPKRSILKKFCFLVFPYEKRRGTLIRSTPGIKKVKSLPHHKFHQCHSFSLLFKGES